MNRLESALGFHRSGLLDKAEEAYRQVLESEQENGDARNLLAMLLADRGDFDEAIKLMERAVEAYPDNLTFQLNYASILARMGRSASCNRVYSEAIALHPDRFEPHAHYGLHLAQMGQLHQAEPFLERSVALNPDDSALQVNYGNALRGLGKVEEAIAVFEKAIRIDQRNPIAYNSLGESLAALGRIEEAVGAFRACLDIDASYLKGIGNLGIALHKFGRISESRKWIEKAIELDGENADHFASLGSLLRDSCEVEEALLRFQRAFELDANNADIVSKYLYTLNFATGLDRSEVENRHRLINGCVTSAKRSWRKPIGGETLTVGFLSGDFCYHSVAFFLAPLYEAIDRARFKIVSFAEVSNRDAMTERLRSLSDEWIETQGRSARSIAAEIDEKGVDILIDLAGHTAGGRLDVVALSPSPIVLNWLGYPHNVGLESIDGRIVDAVTDPIDVEQDACSERPIRMKDCFLCFEAREDAPDVASLPMSRGNPVTFGSFNNAAKLNGTIIAIWSRVLRDIEGSRLILKSWQYADEEMRERIIAIFERNGVARERVEFANRVDSYAAHLGLYGKIDVALDTFPYNGTTTTCEALWMGVPVVTLQGEVHASRVGASLLRTVGSPEWVATDEREFSAIARSLVSDETRLGSVRNALRERLLASPLGDRARFARNFEEALFFAIESISQTRSVDVDTLLRTGLELQKSGKLEAAASNYDEILRVYPEHLQARHYLGVVYYAKGDFNAAVDHLSQVAAHTNADAEMLTNYGSSLQKVGRFEAALDAHRRALDIDPANTRSLLNYGNALSEGGNASDALRIYKRCLQLAPENARAWASYGTALKRSGALVDAVHAFSKATEVDPHFVGAYSNLGSALVSIGDVDKAIEVLRKAVELQPGYLVAHSNLIFALQYSDRVEVSDLREATRAFGALLEDLPKRSVEPTSNDSLRIGFVSADLREHAVARFLVPLLEHAAQSRVEVFLYSDSAITDSFSVRLRSLAASWRSIYGKSDASVASLVNEDRIDALVDLSGHSSSNRLALFARRPAAIQMTWLGFPGSTGLSAMDYRIADAVTLTDIEARSFPEEPLRLDEGFHCIQFDSAPDESAVPSASGEMFTFASFNNISKLSGKTIAVWSKILIRAPETRLLLKSYQFEDAKVVDLVARKFETHGIGRERVSFRPPVAGYRDHLESYREADLCLDPFPYNGTTTTCEALYMGVPVVALLGTRASARTGASLLTQVGLDGFICASEAEYIDMAVGWVGKSAELTRLRGQLRGDFNRSSLGNAKRFSKSFFESIGKRVSENRTKANTMSANEPQLNGSDLQWIESMDLSNGKTPGSVVYPVNEYDIPDDLSGRRVLDASCIDGFWTVFALRRGATDVTALPAEGYLEIGDQGSPRLLRKAQFEAAISGCDKGAATAALLPEQVYQLDPSIHGMFECVFFHSNTNRLRHLLFALDTLRGVCSGELFMTIGICGSDEDSDDEVAAILVDEGPTWLPTLAGIGKLIESASFDLVSLTRVSLDDGQSFALIRARPSG